MRALLSYSGSENKWCAVPELVFHETVSKRKDEVSIQAVQGLHYFL